MYAKKRVCSQKNMCRGIPGLRINTVFNTKDKKLIKREKLYKGIKLHRALKKTITYRNPVVPKVVSL